MHFLRWFALLVFLLLGSLQVLASTSTVIELREDQYLVVNGQSLRQVEVSVDCDAMCVRWGSIVCDLKPLIISEKTYEPAPRENYENHPFVESCTASIRHQRKCRFPLSRSEGSRADIER